MAASSGRKQIGPDGKARVAASGKQIIGGDCCCGTAFCATTCCDDTCDLYYISGVTAPFYFKYDGVCYYAGAAIDGPGSGLAELTAGDVTEYDSCDECNTFKAKRCSDDTYSDIGVPGVCGLTYFRQHGICYYVDTSHTAGGATAYDPDSASITNCSDLDCCASINSNDICGGSNPAEITVTISGVTTGCVASGSVTVSINGTWTLSRHFDGSSYYYCLIVPGAFSNGDNLLISLNNSGTRGFAFLASACGPSEVCDDSGEATSSGGYVFQADDVCFKAGVSYSNDITSCGTSDVRGYGGTIVFDWSC